MSCVGDRSETRKQANPLRLNVNKHERAIFAQCVLPNGKFLFSFISSHIACCYANNQTPVKLFSPISVTTCDNANITCRHSRRFPRSGTEKNRIGDSISVDCITARIGGTFGCRLNRCHPAAGRRSPARSKDPLARKPFMIRQFI